MDSFYFLRLFKDSTCYIITQMVGFSYYQSFLKYYVSFYNLICQKTTMDNKQQMPQISYYHNLKHYKPLWYSGEGIPFLLIHDTYCSSVPCIIFVNLIFILIIVLLAVFGGKPSQEQFKSVILKLAILVFVLLNISYFLTLFMNPGIVSEHHMQGQLDQVKFCQRCHRRTIKMQHCIQCEVCVQDLDHHCGFFGKCIAGRQRFAFYGFMVFMFAAFIVLLSGISLAIN